MTVNPSDYDLIQDDRLDQLESLITAEYEPPSGAQYSYPVASQGITQDQWQQMHLAAGDGAISTEDSTHSFLLEGHDTDSETNQRNTLLLRVSRNTSRNEASLAGFYFRQTEDIELPFPPVTTATTYYVTITYDPRKFKTEPLRIEVWAGTPPRAYGQRHIILSAVQRQPNQLLSQSVITPYRQSVSPAITVSSASQLPEATDVLHHTLGVVRNRVVSGTQVEGTGQLYEARGTAGWRNLLVGPWRNVSTFNAGWEASYCKARYRLGGIDLVARGRIIGPQNALFELPSDMALSESFYAQVPVTGSSGGATTRLSISSGAPRGRVLETTIATWINISLHIPDYYLAN